MVYGGKNGLITKHTRWPNATIPYYIDDDFGKNMNVKTQSTLICFINFYPNFCIEEDFQNMNGLLQAMQVYHDKTCIRFRPYRDTDRNWIEISSDHNGCWSSVGMKSHGQIVNLGSPKCLGRGVIMHELMHVCGFFHQQSASERDEFVRIHWDNIRRGREHNFQKYDEALITNYNVSYDYDSIMHYSSRAFSRNGQATIEPIVRNN